MAARSGRPVQLFILTVVPVLVIEGALVALIGRGPVLVALPWVELTAQSFAILSALCIAYFSLGRHRVLGEPSTLWVGLAFWAYAIFAALYVLVFPGVVGEDSVLRVHPNDFGWPFHYKLTALALLLIVAAVARWPNREASGRQNDLMLFVAVGLFSLLA